MSSMSKRCPLITTHVKCARISREPSNSRVRQFLSVVLKKETLVFVLKRSVNPCFHFQTGQGQITPSAMCFTPTLHTTAGSDWAWKYCFVLLFYPDQPATTTPQIFHHAHLINTYTNTPPLSTLTDIMHGYSRPFGHSTYIYFRSEGNVWNQQL